VGPADGPASFVAAGVTPGSMKNVTHIDVKYTTDVPIRIRLMTGDAVDPVDTACWPASAPPSGRRASG
jgi:hypothetical protein